MTEWSQNGSQSCAINLIFIETQSAQWSVSAWDLNQQKPNLNNDNNNK